MVNLLVATRIRPSRCFHNLGSLESCWVRPWFSPTSNNMCWIFCALTSALTIVNDTPDTWYCRIGPDGAAVETSSYILSGIATVLGPVPNPYSAAASAGLSVTAMVMTAAAYTANNGGFVKISPGGRNKWDHLTLSLWQQGECMKFSPVDPINDRVTFSFDKLMMRPIFSGSTAGSNIDHSIQWWIDKWGIDSTTLQTDYDPFPVPGGTKFLIVNVESGKVLDVDHNRCDDGTNVHLWTKHWPEPADSQIFTYDEKTDTIVHVYCNKALDILGGQCHNGNNIQLVTRKAIEGPFGPQEWIWSYDGVDNRNVMIVNPMCNKALDVSGGGSADGTNIHLWDKNYSPAQVWDLIPVN